MLQIYDKYYSALYVPQIKMILCIFFQVNNRYLSSIRTQVMSQESHSQMYYLKGLTTLDSSKLMKMESSHIMIMYFFINGLHILDKQELIEKSGYKQKLIQYIKSLQLKNGSYTCSTLYANMSKSAQQSNKYEVGHIVFTYSAINSLYLLGETTKVNKQLVLSSIEQCKKQDGSFSSFPESSECDLRFVYSALAICKLFDDFSIIDQHKTLAYINSCFNYDGGFGLRPKTQSHSGAIFCAIASYEHLQQQIPKAMKRKLLNFLANRQSTQLENLDIVGVQGRIGKLPDSCYSFWIGASIMMITKGVNLLNKNIQNFLKLCFKPKQQSFAKYPSNSSGDPVHTFHSILGTKILREDVHNISLSQILRKQDK